MFAGATAPSGWLICDGSAISRTTYSTLYAVIGTTYGSGDGSTTFNLPDLRGRVAVGVGNGTATGHTNHTLGQKSGNENTIVPYHHHGLHDTDTGQYFMGVNYGTVGGVGEARVATSSTGTHYVPRNASADVDYAAKQYTAYAGSSGNTTGANMMPYIGLNYIICTGNTTA